MLVIDVLLNSLANVAIITLVSYIFVKILPKRKEFTLSVKRKVSIVLISSLTTFILMFFSVNLPEAVKIDMRFNVLILLLSYFGSAFFVPTAFFTALLRLTWGINQAAMYTFILYVILAISMPFFRKKLIRHFNPTVTVLTLNGIYIVSHSFVLYLLYQDVSRSLFIGSMNFAFSSSCLILVMFFIDDMLYNRNLYLEEKHRAKSDFLTGLYNRAAFSRHWEKIENNPGIQQTAFLMLDIDYFKQINDQYGHANGDIVLQQLADILHTQHVEFTDIYRVGGEEFCIILNNVSGPKQRKIAENIRASIEQTLFHLENHQKIHLTVSIGLASLSKEKNMKKLYRLADKALYLAKEKGRNQVVALEETNLE